MAWARGLPDASSSAMFSPTILSDFPLFKGIASSRSS